MGFLRGKDWITPGGSQSKTGEASPTLRHIMNQVEVPVSQVGGCKRGKEEEGREREGMWKVCMCGWGGGWGGGRKATGGG